MFLCYLIHLDTNSTTTQGTATAATPTATGSDASNTDPITVPTSAAMSGHSLNAGFLAFFSLLGFTMA